MTVTGRHEPSESERSSPTAQEQTTVEGTGRHGANRPGSQEVRGFESHRLSNFEHTGLSQLTGIFADTSNPTKWRCSNPCTQQRANFSSGRRTYRGARIRVTTL